jgi:hypothetical protein
MAEDRRQKAEGRRQRMTDKKGAEDEYSMDRQYQYLFVGDSDYHGVLSHHTG